MLMWKLFLDNCNWTPSSLSQCRITARISPSNFLGFDLHFSGSTQGSAFGPPGPIFPISRKISGRPIRKNPARFPEIFKFPSRSWSPIGIKSGGPISVRPIAYAPGTPKIRCQITTKGRLSNLASFWLVKFTVDDSFCTPFFASQS